jgi:hypothetical protein
MRPRAGNAGAGANPEKPMADIPTPERVALVRRRYLERATVRTIRVESGINNLDIIYRCLAGEFADGSGAPPAPIPLRRPGVRIRGRAGSRTALVARMWRSAERQVEEIEERLDAAGLEPGEREGNARTLATLARTLRELAALEASKRPRGQAAQNPGDNDPVPRNVEELRRSLAEKLEAIVAGTAKSVPGGAE